tara:strand:+ start:7797 stop:9968 length:2172 start_codon:yes stop_codon:yes gene_type:complete
MARKEEKILGVPFSPGVKKQLEVRSEKINNRSRGIKELKVFNQNTSFIRLCSSINDNNATDPSDLASRNILFGGSFTTRKIGETEDGRDVTKLKVRRGVQLGSNKIKDQNAYIWDREKGYRPFSGIVGATIVPQNNLGTVRKATISIQCFTLEELNKIEKLYLKPGYTMLLEFGHTLYFNNDGSYDSRVKGVYEEFFKDRTKDENAQEKIQNAILDVRESSGFNYDALLGRVTNFSWSYRQDGGYDITLDMISSGELVESIESLIFPPADLFKNLDKKNNNNEGSNFSIEYSEKYLTLFQSFYRIILDENSVGVLPNLFKNQVTDKLKDLIPSRFLKDSFYTNDFDLILSLVYSDHPTFFTIRDNTLKFVSLRTLLITINQFIFPHTSESGESPYISFNTTRGKNTYATFDQHYSRNPNICIIPNSKSIVAGKSIEIREFGSKEFPDILDILVNVEFVETLIVNQFKESKVTDKNSFYDFLEEILKGINSAAGGVNNLDIHFSEENQQLFIIDRNLPIDTSNIPVLNITGLKSEATEVNFTTKISSELSSFLAAGASVAGTDITEALEGLVQLNSGLVDRVNPSKVPLSDFFDKDKQNSIVEEIDDIEKRLIEVYSNYIDGTKRKESFLDSVATSHKKYSQFYFKRRSKNFSNVTGIVPFEIEIKIKGISGIRMFQSFKINRGLLPKRYQDSTAFVVTKIAQDIQNNQWYTTFSGRIYINNKQ